VNFSFSKRSISENKWRRDFEMKNKNEEKNTIQIGVTIEMKDYKKIKDVATSQKRSISNLVSFIITNWIKNDIIPPNPKNLGEIK